MLLHRSLRLHWPLSLLTLLAIALGASPQPVHAQQDVVEFLNGTTMECEILEIRKELKEFDVQTRVGDNVLKRTYPYSKVHAVTIRGNRFELTPKSGSQQAEVPSESGQANGDQPTRTRQEVLQLIEEAGSTPPSWYAATAINPPDSLDLSWPLKAEGKWNNQKNVGQYIWDIINPNERRWHAGIKLVHHCMSLHKNDRNLLARDIDKLATMYFTLLQDYARAAFWFQKSGADATSPGGVHLAECYWRLGNKDMAMGMLRGKMLPWNAVKLLGDMGEIEDALRVANVYAKSQVANEVFLSAGDALRNANRLDEAIEYYQRVLDLDTARNEEYKQRFDARAKESIEAIRLFDKANVANVADGSYRDSSTGYNGPLEIEVQVMSGKVESLKVTSHSEKQFYAALTDTPKQIIAKQSVQDIDGTSGATITSQAIVNATAKALAQGAKQQ